MANAEPAKCQLDIPWFKYSALDTFVVRDVSADEVNAMLRAPSDPAMIQIGLWYVFRNQPQAAKVWAGTDPEQLFERGGDPARAVWYLLFQGRAEAVEPLMPAVRQRLLGKVSAWKTNLLREKPSRSLMLDIYAGGTGKAANTSVPIGEDVDMIWQRGHEYQAAGRIKDAFGEYQRVAEYGNPAALISAAMLALDVGGEACFARSRFYFGLGGMWGRVQWTTLPGGRPEARPFKRTE